MVTFTVEVWACFCDGKTSLYIDDEFISDGENQGSETRDGEVFEIFTQSLRKLAAELIPDTLEEFIKTSPN